MGGSAGGGGGGRREVPAEARLQSSRRVAGKEAAAALELHVAHLERLARERHAARTLAHVVAERHEHRRAPCAAERGRPCAQPAGADVPVEGGDGAQHRDELRELGRGECHRRAAQHLILLGIQLADARERNDEVLRARRGGGGGRVGVGVGGGLVSLQRAHEVVHREAAVVVRVEPAHGLVHEIDRRLQLQPAQRRVELGARHQPRARRVEGVEGLPRREAARAQPAVRRR